MKELIELEKQYFLANYFTGISKEWKYIFVVDPCQELNIAKIYEKRDSDETITIAPISDLSDGKFQLVGPWEEIEYRKLSFAHWAE